jgi:hypothetical protein
MQLDLGHLQMSNNFEWHGCKESDPSAVHLDVLHAEVCNFQFFCFFIKLFHCYNEEFTFLNECMKLHLILRFSLLSR